MSPLGTLNDHLVPRHRAAVQVKGCTGAAACWNHPAASAEQKGTYVLPTVTHSSPEAG